MKRSLMTLASLLAGTLLAWSQQPSEPVTAVKPSAVAEANPTIQDARYLMNELREEMNAFQEKLRAEKDRVAQKALYAKRPVAGERTGKVLEIVKGNLKEENVDEVLSWVLSHGTAAEKSEGLDLMLTHFKASPELEGYVLRLGYYGPKEDLEKVIKEAADEKVKLAARLELASFLAQGAERNSELTDKARSEMNAEVKGILESLRDVEGLAENYPKIAKEVESKLFKIEHLAIGCVAPEIVGVDHAGEEFKLSDYRGKVTLVDFWGIW